MLDSLYSTSPAYIYRAVKSREVGISSNGNVVTGLVLELHSGPDPDTHPNFAPDWLEQEVEDVGEIDLTIPKEGLVEGGLYRLKAVDFVTDWETGVAEDYRLVLVLIGGDDDT